MLNPGKANAVLSLPVGRRKRTPSGRAGVTADEFEQGVGYPDETVESKSSGRPAAVGYTASGRYLICVFELIDDVTVYPITAYELIEE